MNWLSFHRHAVARRRRKTISIGRWAVWLLILAPAPLVQAAAPDLIIWQDALNPITTVYTATDCEVLENCGLPGPRRYLRFTTQSRNIGNADLFLGDPASNTNFVYFSCHRHYHFTDFADYRLVNSAGLPVANGKKIGFCLLDSGRWDSSAGIAARYTCDNQGIQAGWYDVYTADLPCQWVDVTDVPPGNYLLELEANPAGRLPELTRSNNITRASVVIDAPCSGPPANDNFADAIVLSGRVGSAFSSTGCATPESGEPNHAPASSEAVNSVWFRWTAPYSGNVVMTTEGSTFDTVMAVYRGTDVTSLTSVAKNDDDMTKTPVQITSRVTFAATVNTVYSIAVAGYLTAEGGVALNINPGSNDVFSTALVLTGATGSVSCRNTTARRETGEPMHAGVLGTNSVWYCWQAPASGLVRFDTEGSNFDTLLAVYTGTRVTNLTAVASDNDSGTNKTSRLSFQAVAGTNYWIAVDGVNGQCGFVRLNWGAPSSGPRFNSIVRLPGGDKQLQLTGQIGQQYRIETSSDLAGWSNWLRLTNLSGSLQFTDPASNNAPQRFYRAVVTP